MSKDASEQLELMVAKAKSPRQAVGKTDETEYERLVKKSNKSRLEDNLFEEFKLYGLPLPVRQYRFHPVRKWPFDFAWPDRKIALEVQGGIYVGGGHSRGFGYELDCTKENEATKMGWQVYRFGSSQCRRKQRTQQSSIALEFMYSILKPEE